MTWRCFHCDAVFTLRSEASAHFGYEVDATPACRIAPDLRGLIKLMRWQEAELQRFRREDSDASRQFYALGADHARALQAEEEKGYAKGLADVSKLREQTIEECALVVDRWASEITKAGDQFDKGGDIYAHANVCQGVAASVRALKFEPPRSLRTTSHRGNR